MHRILELELEQTNNDVQCSNEITITIINTGRKFRGRAESHLTQSRLGWGLSPCQVLSWSIQPSGHNKHGPKIGGGLCPLFGGGKQGPHLTQSRRKPRPTFIPSGILIYAAIWPQWIWAENWRAVPLWGGEAGFVLFLTQCGQGEAYLHAKFHLDPSKRLATIHQRYRQIYRHTDRQDRQRSDSIRRTILQMVAQKLRALGYIPVTESLGKPLLCSAPQKLVNSVK